MRVVIDTNIMVSAYLGEVMESGLAKEVFDNPKHERTRQYLEGLF